MKHKKTALIVGAAVLLALVLALPLVTGFLKNTSLLAGRDTVQTGYGLSAQGAQYPFAQRLYQQAMAAPADQAGETAEISLAYDDAGQPLLEKALQSFLDDNGVGDVTDWVPVYTYVKASQSYCGRYSRLLRMYAVALCNNGGGSAYCSAYSIAAEDLTLYGIVFDPTDVPKLPDATTDWAQLGQSDAPVAGTLHQVGWGGAVFAEDAAYVLIEEPGSMVGRLARVDYATGSISYPFCTAADCTHTQESCAARMDITGRSLWDMGGNVFLAWWDSDDNRERGCYLYPQTATRGNEIILPTGGIGWQNVTDGRVWWTVNYEKRLVAVDLDDGGRTVLADKAALAAALFPQEVLTENTDSLIAGFWPNVMGYTADGQLLISCHIVSENGYFDSQGQYLPGTARDRLVAYDLATRSFGPVLYSHDGDDRQLLLAQEGSVYAVDRVAGAIWQLDTRTGAKTLVADGLTMTPSANVQMAAGRIVWDNEYIHADGITRHFERFYWDADAGCQKPLTLTAYRKGEQRPITLSGGRGDWLYVNYETVPVTITETVYGQPNTYVSEQHHMGLMTAEDFFADRLQVLPVS